MSKNYDKIKREVSTLYRAANIMGMAGVSTSTILDCAEQKQTQLAKSILQELTTYLANNSGYIASQPRTVCRELRQLLSNYP